MLSNIVRPPVSPPRSRYLGADRADQKRALADYKELSSAAAVQRALAQEGGGVLVTYTLMKLLDVVVVPLNIVSTCRKLA